MNYSVNHNLLKDPYISNLNGSLQTATWLVYCCILHFTKTVGNVNFYSTAFARDYKFKPKTVKAAIDGLIEADMIKRTRLYQRKGNIPAQYIATRYSPKVTKVRPQGTKGIAPGAKVNNYINNYNTEGVSLNTPPSPKLSTPLTKEEIEKYLNDNK